MSELVTSRNFELKEKTQSDKQRKNIENKLLKIDYSPANELKLLISQQKKQSKGDSAIKNKLSSRPISG